MRTLLVGGGGLLGRHLRDALGPDDLIATYHKEVVDDSMRLDLEDETATRHLIRDVCPDVIVVAAAEAHVERCEREPTATRRINVDAVRPVAEEAYRRGALLVVFSSEYVFDGTGGRYDEDDETAPLNEYGRQKVDLERIALGVGRHLVLRTSGVFGHEPAGKNFVCQLVRSLREGRSFIVPADQLITPTYAPSLAGAVATLVARGATGTFHVVGPRIMPRPAFAELVCQVFGLDPGLVDPRPTDELGLAAPRPRRAGLADEKIRGSLGHALADPEVGLVEMTRRG